MRYFAILDFQDQPPGSVPATLAGLPCHHERTWAIAQAAHLGHAERTYSTAGELWRIFSLASQRAQALNCEIVIYLPYRETQHHRETELSVACELAIRGYFALLKQSAGGAIWAATTAANLHAYGQKLGQVLRHTQRQDAIGLSGIFVFAANVWLGLDPNTTTPALKELPLAWFWQQPERLALAGW